MGEEGGWGGVTKHTKEEVKRERRKDSPEDHHLSLSHCDVVHHPVVGLRIPLAADGQPCRHNKQNPQREKKRAFGKGDKVSWQRHGGSGRARNGGVEKRSIYSHSREGRQSARVSQWRLFSTPYSARRPLSPTLIQIFSPGVASAD